jgi:hypothetical protein
MWNAKPSKLVAVVVPLSARTELTPDEQISLRHLRHFLGAYDKFMIAPPGVEVPHADFTVQHFDSSFFGSVKAHMDLLVSPTFYRAFKDYQFILIYHLDALIFSDRLKEWCARDFDYIAPPWIQYPGSPYEKLPIGNQVGNGGFSLRNVQSFLRVLRRVRRPRPTLDYLRRILRRRKRIEDKLAEDIFWGTMAHQIDPSFRVAPFETALQFAFECNPRLCFETNGRQMPFGCHAWPRYDRAFWEPHLIAAES